MNNLREYINFKQELWDTFQAEIDATKMNSLAGHPLKLYWGRREIQQILDAALPELQLISSAITTPEAISDQEEFVFPQTNSIVFRLIDRSALDGKDAEMQVLDLASKVLEILKKLGTMGQKITAPIVSRVDFQDMNDGRSFYYGADIAFEARLTL